MAATNKISRSDEIRDKSAIRQPVDFVRRARLLDQSVTHHDDAVRHRQRFFQVVGHVDRGDAEAMLKSRSSIRISARNLASRFDSGSSNNRTEG